MKDFSDAGRLRNALLMLGLGGLILALFGLSNLTSPAAGVTDSLSTETLQPNLTASPVGEVSIEITPTPRRIVKTNTPLPTLIPSSTPYPLLYNYNGAAIPITWEDYPPPTTWPSTLVPPPMGLLPKPDDQINIIILGNDFRPRKGARTDVIMLLSLNPGAGTASLISFPRAMYVYAPGWTMMPLHTVQPRGGYDLLFETFRYNFGVRLDRYINISMKNFEAVVDSIGGIDVEVAEYLSDPTYAGGKFSVEPGLVHMNGRMARWYARSRMTSSDFARAPRQQALMKAVFIKLMRIDAQSRVPELYTKYLNNVVTDLTLSDLLLFIPLAGRLLDTSRVSQYAINLDHVSAWTTPVDGAYVFLPDREAILALLLKASAP